MISVCLDSSEFGNVESYNHLGWEKPLMVTGSDGEILNGLWAAPKEMIALGLGSAVHLRLFKAEPSSGAIHVLYITLYKT